MVYCPECGGEMGYNKIVKSYICNSCGLSVTYQELLELRDKIRSKIRKREEDEENEKRKDYLNWWLKSKKEK